jgi:hypothetical protein
LIHDQGWRPRLASRPRATRRHSCTDGVSFGQELRRFLGSLSRKHDWLSFDSLLVNLSVFHHVRVTSSLRSSVRSGPGVQCPFWGMIRTTSDVNSINFPFWILASRGKKKPKSLHVPHQKIWYFGWN